MTDEVINEDLGADHPHETPHFKPDGSCDCICDDCMTPEADDFMRYTCICPNCKGECGSPHEVG